MPLTCRLTVATLSFVLLFVATARANDPFLLNDYALQLLQKGENEKALEQFQKAYALYPYNETLRHNLAEVYTVVGDRQMSSGRYEEAAASFDNARELLPEVQRYRVLRGIALYSARQYDAAIVELEKARGYGGDTADLLHFLGRAHYDNGNLPMAIQLWEKALELDSKRLDVSSLVEKARREQAVEGRMDRGYSSRFTVSFDGDRRGKLADQVLDVLETAYNRVGSDLSHFPTARVPVILYTRTDYRSVTNGPDWSGGLYDGKIRLPIGGVEDMNEVLRSILFHEYTHVVVHDLTSGNCPVWLNEGLAELQGRRELPHPLTELSRAVKNGTILPLSTLESPFTALPARDAALAYQQSYSLVRYIINIYGWHKVKEILVSLGSGKRISTAVAAAMADYGVDYPALYQEWLTAVKKELAGS